MSNHNLYRLAGWSAVLSVVFSFGMFAFAAERGAAFMVVSIISSIFLAITMVALYVLHRPEAATLSLVMLVCAVIGLILENVGTGPGTTLFFFTNLIYGVALLLVGYLGLRSPAMPNWLAILAGLTGIGTLGVGFANVLGLPEAIGNAAMGIQFLAWIIWSIGILWLFVWSKSFKARTAAV